MATKLMPKAVTLATLSAVTDEETSCRLGIPRTIAVPIAVINGGEFVWEKRPERLIVHQIKFIVSYPRLFAFPYTQNNNGRFYLIWRAPSEPLYMQINNRSMYLTISVVNVQGETF